MKIYTKDDYSKAYTELLEILRYVSQEDYDEIPKVLIEFFEENKENNYLYNYEIDLPFEQQKISRLTKILIASLYVNYWTTNEEKEQIKIKDNEYLIKLEEKKRKMYNPDDIFRQNEEFVDKSDFKNQLIVKENRNIILRIMKKLKERLFNKSKEE